MESAVKAPDEIAEVAMVEVSRLQRHALVRLLPEGLCPQAFVKQSRFGGTTMTQNEVRRIALALYRAGQRKPTLPAVSILQGK